MPSVTQQENLKLGKSPPQIDKNVDTDNSEKLVYKILRDEIAHLTHEKCNKFLEMESFAGERDVTDSWVQYLYDEWKRGRFLWDNVVIATARLADEPRRVFHINGQHTCWMRLYAPPAAPASVRWIDYEVKTKDQLRALYAVFDRGRGRTPGHIVKALLAGEIGEVWTSLIVKLSAGMKMWLWPTKEEQRRHGPQELASLARGVHRDLFDRVGKLVQEHWTQLHMRRAPVIAAMFATYSAKPALADDFWVPVATGLKLEKATDPRYKLREYLTVSTVDRAGVGAEAMFRVSINAWNKHRRGESAQASLRPTEKRQKVA